MLNRKVPTDEDVVKDPHRHIGHFIEENKARLLNTIRKYVKSNDDAEDVFQDACMALFNNIQGGKLDCRTAKLSTYFAQISINLSLKKIRDSKRIVSAPKAQFDADKVDELLQYTRDTVYTPRQIGMIPKILLRLPEPCNKILWKYYGYDWSMEEIALAGVYRDAATVKSKKWQCMQRLSRVIDDKTKAEFYEED